MVKLHFLCVVVRIFGENILREHTKGHTLYCQELERLKMITEIIEICFCSQINYNRSDIENNR
jgi:hypothetical protein